MHFVSMILEKIEISLVDSNSDITFTFNEFLGFFWSLAVADKGWNSYSFGVPGHYQTLEPKGSGDNLANAAYENKCEGKD